MRPLVRPLVHPLVGPLVRPLMRPRAGVTCATRRAAVCMRLEGYGAVCRLLEEYSVLDYDGRVAWIFR